MKTTSTNRSELISMAAYLVKHQGLSAHMALEATVDGFRALSRTTPGAAMRRYYLECSDQALTRLINAVEREAQR